MARKECAAGVIGSCMSWATPLQADMCASTLLNKECSKSHGGSDKAEIAAVGA